MLKLNLFLGRRKRIERRVKEANNNNLTIISNSCAQEQYNTPRCFYPLEPKQGGVSTTISHTAWAGLPGHGPIQSKCFPIQSRGRTNTKKYRVLSQAERGGLKWKGERHRMYLGQGCGGCDKTQAEHKEPCKRHSKNSLYIFEMD